MSDLFCYCFLAERPCPHLNLRATSHDFRSDYMFAMLVLLGLAEGVSQGVALRCPAADRQVQPSRTYLHDSFGLLNTSCSIMSPPAKIHFDHPTKKQGQNACDPDLLHREDQLLFCTDPKFDGENVPEYVGRNLPCRHTQGIWQDIGRGRIFCVEWNGERAVLRVDQGEEQPRCEGSALHHRHAQPMAGHLAWPLSS